MSDKPKAKSRKTVSRKPKLGLDLTDKELDLAKRVFAIKHPYIDFNFKGYIKEKIYEDAATYGIGENALPVSYSQVCQRIKTLGNDLNNFLAVMNSHLANSLRGFGDVEAVIAEHQPLLGDSKAIQDLKAIDVKQISSAV